MKNTIILGILAILTIAALISWNITSRSVDQRRADKSTNQTDSKITPSPTPEAGSALRRIFDNGMFRRDQQRPSPTVEIQLTPISFPTSTPSPTGSPVAMQNQTETKGGQVLPSPTPRNVLGSASNAAASSQYSNVVTLSENGFSPNSLSVKSGTMVLFLNASNNQMWIIGDNSSFDMGQAVGKGGSFEYRFTSIGEFGYSNKQNLSHKGKITVTD
ncbi:MAG: hypothetical protein N3A54_05750 [Patescibacteria group bacterium]|nr:hypothetical protein [Patescibacteria group bacterium]